MELTLEQLWAEFITLRAQHDALMEILVNQVSFPKDVQAILNKHLELAAAKYGLQANIPQPQEPAPRLRLVRREDRNQGPAP